MTFETVATGVRFGEGPTWRASTGDLLVVSVLDGVLWRVDPSTGSTTLFADTGGGPNGTTLWSTRSRGLQAPS